MSDVDTGGRLRDLAAAGTGRARLPGGDEVRRRGRRRRARRRVTAGAAALLAAGLAAITLRPAPTPAPPPAAPAPPPVVLGGDGIGAARFGDSEAAAVDAVRRVYGAPATDSGWLTVGDQVQGCPGTQVRKLTWGGLTLYLSDGPTDYATGSRHLFAWSVERPAGRGVLPTTAAGVTAGSTVGALRRAYPGAVEMLPGQERTDLSVRAPGGTLLGMAEGTGDADAVTLLAGGQTCEW